MRCLPVFVTIAGIMLAAPVAAETVTRPCRISLIDEAHVPAQEQGLLTEMVARDGQQVEEGEVIARIDDTLAKLQYNVAEQELKVAQKRAEDRVSVEYAQGAAAVYLKEYQRLIETNKKVPGSKPQAEVELTRLQYEQYRLQTEKSLFELEIAAAEAKVSEANLAAAEEHILRREIKAPWAGAVAQVVRHTGDWVQPGDPVLRLVRMDKLYAVVGFNVNEYPANEIIGQPVTVTATLARGKTQTFSGRVVGVSPLVEVNNIFRVWAEIDNHKDNGVWLLRDGMAAEMMIELK